MRLYSTPTPTTATGPPTRLTPVVPGKVGHTKRSPRKPYADRAHTWRGEPKGRQTPSQYTSLSAGSGLLSFGMGLLVPVLPLYAQSLGAGAAQVGLLIAGFALARLLAALPAVWLARRVGYRRLLVGSPAVSAPASLLCAVGGFWTLVIFCVVEGAASAVYATIGTSAIVTGQEARERPGRSLATYQSATLLGATVGPALGGLVAQQFGLRAPFFLYAVGAALVAWWLHKQLDHGDATLAGEPGLSGPKTPMEQPSILRTLAAPRLLAFWLVVFALTFARLGTQLTIGPLLGAWQLGLGPSQIGLALSLTGLITLTAFYPSGWLADRYSRKAVITGGAVVTIAALVLFATSGSYTLFLGASILLGIGTGMAGPAPLVYLGDVLSAHAMAAAVGVYRTVSDAGATIAPLLLGWIAASGGYDLSLITAIILLLIAAVSFVGLAPAEMDKSQAVAE